MPKVQLLNMQGAQVGEIELNESIFGITPNIHVLHSAVVSQLASRRRGTQSALTRAEVSGGGRKPWRQKGTGRARSGSSRSPVWRSGGIVFAPKPRKYDFKLPKKVRRLALHSALSSKVMEQQLIVLDALSMDQAKTREMVKVLKALQINKKAMIVMDNLDEDVLRSARNIEGVKTTDVAGMNVVDLLQHDILVMTKAAVTKTEEVLA
ncbi:MAG: 50S ribosomal protein L4 [Bacillota bacterium]|nr:50S ribosomal protein L4 [Bacillota bacterium]